MQLRLFLFSSALLISACAKHPIAAPPPAPAPAPVEQLHRKISPGSYKVESMYGVAEVYLGNDSKGIEVKEDNVAGNQMQSVRMFTWSQVGPHLYINNICSIGRGAYASSPWSYSPSEAFDISMISDSAFYAVSAEEKFQSTWRVSMLDPRFKVGAGLPSECPKESFNFQ